VFDRDGALAVVLDVDSTEPAAFDAEDQAGLEALCAVLLRTA
jgi:L-methionine (R)-S-oxide reductase